MEIRPETPPDHIAIRALVDAAFGGTMESLLIDLIRASDRFVPDLALVAVSDGIPIGHVLFSRVTISGKQDHEVLSLAPLAVHPDHQRIGVGSALVEEGLEQVAARGEPLVVVEGHPSFYPRFGFEVASGYGIEKAAPQVPDAAFLVKWLGTPDPRYRGRLVYPPAFYEADAIGS
jgi:putative acetyltransferase